MKTTENTLAQGLLMYWHDALLAEKLAAGVIPGV